MLILTRKAEQGIVIDGHTTVRVLSIDGERVKIGIEAPDHITVLRQELVAEVADQNREASQQRPSADAIDRLRRLERSGETPPDDDSPPLRATGGNS